jgi:hypothetical protein
MFICLPFHFEGFFLLFLWVFKRKTFKNKKLFQIVWKSARVCQKTGFLPVRAALLPYTPVGRARYFFNPFQPTSRSFPSSNKNYLTARVPAHQVVR